MRASHRAAAVVTAALLVVGSGSALAAGGGITGTVDLGAVTGAATPVGLPRLLASVGDATTPVTGIATFDAVPTAGITTALEALGLEVQPMHRVPLAIVRGPAAAIETAVATGLADDVYPDEPIQLLDTASSDSLGAAGPRAAGLTGAGVTVAVVDSGCDATHPDLADHVTHNVKLLSGEYANLPPDQRTTIVVPIDQGPYSNTDLGSGHGTHVAGIIAADGTTSPEHLGVAPDASLVCLAIGEALATTAVVTAYDYLLDQPDLLGVDVINNSWGNLYAQYDPRNPVAVVTDAVADLGVHVIFAAGNSGDGNGEATLNPFSQSPSVLAVAAADLEHVRGDFSSNGFRFDNSEDVQIGGGGHTTFLGERIGLVHPDVTAPGVDISSSCDTLGTVIGPCAPGENATASGTSMASPHVAGAAAVLEQVNPGLTPAQLRSVLQVTATPVGAVDGDGAPTGETAPFWEAGYGHVDLAAAVALARDPRQLRRLDRRQAAADAAVLGATGFRVERSDLFRYDAPPVTVGTDQRTFTVDRALGAGFLKVTLAYPSEASVGADLGLTSYSVTVTDAAGRVLLQTSERIGIGTTGNAVPLDLTAAGAAPGPLTLQVVGDLAVSDPDTIDSDSLLNDTVTLQVAQLTRR